MAKARLHGEVAHLQHVAGPGAFDMDGAGHDVDAGIAVGFGNFAEDARDLLVHQQIGSSPA